MLDHGERDELIRKAKEGDRDAFKTLWAAYDQAVRGFVSPRISAGGYIDEDLLNDIVQDAFFKLGKKINTYDDNKGEFFTFIRIWAGYAIKDHLRRRGTRLFYVMLFEEFDYLRDDDELVQTFLEKTPDDQCDLPDIILELDLYERLLKITLRVGGYPHQLIVFCFNQLVDDWTPIAIVGKLSDRRLSNLESKLEADYTTESKLPEHVVLDCFKPLRSNMDQTVGSIVTDRASIVLIQKKEEGILEKRIGTTPLRRYYGGNPEGNISDWSYKVRRRVRQYIAESDELIM